MSKKKTTTKQKPFFFKLIKIIVVILIGLALASYFFINLNSKQTNKTSKNQVTCRALQIIKPASGQKVVSPIEVEVVVNNTNPKCHWSVFEAQAGTISLKDNTGQTIGTGILKTTSDWMTDQPVTYTGTINFDTTPSSNDLILTIFEEPPSGQPNSKQATILLKY